MPRAVYPQRALASPRGLPSDDAPGCSCSWRCVVYIIFATLLLETLFVIISGAHLYTWPYKVLVDANKAYAYRADMTPDEFTYTYTEICSINSRDLDELRPPVPERRSSSGADGGGGVMDAGYDVTGGAYNTTYCPCVPTSLHGRLNVSLVAPPTGEMELAHVELTSGGEWKPSVCRPRFRTAIIVPFRDREEHLRIFLHHMHPILQRQMIAYTIFVVEQRSPGVFNKAQMMNIGFREASRLGVFGCYVFHDVDMLAEDDRNMYTCSHAPRHVGAYCDKFNYSVPYRGLFGGATAFTKKQFEKTNGFTTLFYGWGGEDDDMYRRIRWAGMDVVRYPASVARYTMIKHTGDKGNPYNTRSVAAWNYRPSVYESDGLNTLNYSLASVEHRPLYTWLSALIPPAPASPDNQKKNATNQTFPPKLKRAAVSAASAAKLHILCYCGVLMLAA